MSQNILLAFPFGRPLYPPHVFLRGRRGWAITLGSSPTPKNVSRVVAILFHHPPPRKPVIRRRINLKTSAPSTRASYTDHEPPCPSNPWTRDKDPHTLVSDGWPPVSSLKTAICNTVSFWTENGEQIRSACQHIASHLVVKTPEYTSETILPLSIGNGYLLGTCEALAIEQAQLEQQRCWEYARSPHVMQIPELPIQQTYPQCFASDWQVEQHVPLQPTQMPGPCHEVVPYQEQQRNTFYEQHHQLALSGPPPINTELSFYSPYPQSDFRAIDLTQHHNTHMDFHVPERPMDGSSHAFPVQKQRAAHSALESTPWPVLGSLLPAPQEQFAFRPFDYGPQFEFSEEAPGQTVSGFSSPCTPPLPIHRGAPEMACAVDRYVNGAIVGVTHVTAQEGTSLPSSQVISLTEPVPTPVPTRSTQTIPCTPDHSYPRPHHHQPPAITISPSCPKPFQGFNATETFTFNVVPDTAVPHFDFDLSLRVSMDLPPAPCSPDDAAAAIDCGVGAWNTTIRSIQDVSSVTNANTNDAWKHAPAPAPVVEYPSSGSLPLNRSIHHTHQMLTEQPFHQPREVILSSSQNFLSAVSAPVEATDDDSPTLEAVGKGKEITDAKMDVNGDDDGDSSDSDSSYSDSDSDSEMDSDSDSDSDDSDSESSDDEMNSSNAKEGSQAECPAATKSNSDEPTSNSQSEAAETQEKNVWTKDLDLAPTSFSSRTGPKNEKGGDDGPVDDDDDDDGDDDDDSDGYIEYIPPLQASPNLLMMTTPLPIWK
ncbi:hypothetical protein B0F90DRAFT_850576 [Multifurca ochricompacta]|uniref:Uncharacterized protein n=1 Tax=Multifurca ochricompacta TaxID=376703 RepID=A0AAD4QM72_9AGAM|nr:hypothetical protein B0F90DRAFT_850576 [Multifurca ochricompacta]